MPLALCSLSLSLAAQDAVQERALLQSADLDADDVLGSCVSLSGATAVLGAPGDSDQLSLAGAAYVFVESGGTWTQEAKLTASDAELFNTFGESVSLSGESVLVGASGNGEAGAFAGAAYVFTRSAGVWTQEAKLLAADAEANDLFGFSVALDGDTALVGAFLEDDGGTNAGAAYVFTRSAGVWTQEAKLTPSDPGDRDSFGESVALSGNTAICGARHDDDAGLSSGSAYVFVRSGGNWSQQAKLVANDAAAFDTFGSAVALSGNTALVAASLEDQTALNAGAVYVFLRFGVSWGQQAKLRASDGQAGDLLGVSVSLDGDRALLGASLADPSGADSGAAYVFERNGGLWSEAHKLVASDATGADEFGHAVSVSGERLLAGAPGYEQDPMLATETGAAFLSLIGPAASQLVRQEGSNPSSFTSESPIIGSTIQMAVDLSTTGHTSAAVFAYSAPASVPLSGGRVLLVGGAELFMLPLMGGPLASYSAMVPNDLALVGMTIHTQALHIFGVQPYALSNAIDLTAGF